jgi:hypothetical protein
MALMNSVGQYTLLADGAIYAFLISKSPSIGVVSIFVTAAWFLPFALSVFAALLANHAGGAVYQLGQYLARLEHGLGNDAYGWENSLKHKWGTTGKINYRGLWGFWLFFWMALVLGTLAIGVAYLCLSHGSA